MSSANDLTIQKKMENIFNNTCGTWQNCTESNIQSFLEQCQEHNIDSQYCMSWVEQHKARIPDWSTVSKVSLDWVNEHTSTGSPISFTE
ncbi:hypothetical protein [Metabacillus fastidiosus]|uniref:hypothetical protein n=1 Tax=Metabacillus fastidiosus TaxID=1458 RepID=UPI002DB56049|nr:hypothetical protein [Metabacillus fastidiosus]MEC2074605.1 hypothetical protein [Metabacillus fastidiosus]